MELSRCVKVGWTVETMQKNITDIYCNIGRGDHMHANFFHGGYPFLTKFKF